MHQFLDRGIQLVQDKADRGVINVEHHWLASEGFSPSDKGHYSGMELPPVYGLAQHGAIFALISDLEPLIITFPAKCCIASICKDVGYVIAVPSHIVKEDAVVGGYAVMPPQQVSSGLLI